jgi:hypothetical protein
LLVVTETCGQTEVKIMVETRIWRVHGWSGFRIVNTATIRTCD